jgi:hypothetical protein
MKRFTNNIVDIKRGTTDVSKIYRGDIQVWPDGGDPTPWYNTSWDYRIAFEVDSTKLSGDVTNLPTYLDLSLLPTEFHTNVKTDGGDIRITTSDGQTEVARELVFYNNTNDEGEVWFLAPSVSSSSNTKFYIYYGNSGASDYADSDTYGQYNVWNSDYRIVSHWQDTHINSTTYSNNWFVPSFGVVGFTQSGQINTSLHQISGGFGQQYTMNSSATLQPGTGPFTTQIWFYANDYNINNANILLNGPNKDPNGQQFFQLVETNQVIYRKLIGSKGLNYDTIVPYTFNLNEWYHVLVTREGSGSGTVSVYINGELEGTDTGTFHTMNNSTLLSLGGANNFINRAYVDGFRWIHNSKNADEVKAEYNNQLDPSTFFSIGSEQVKP